MWPHFLKNGHVPEKFFFAIFSKNVAFFEKIVKMKKYSKPHFSQKRLYSFSLPDAPFPSKETCPQKHFFAFFSERIVFKKIC